MNEGAGWWLSRILAGFLLGFGVTELVQWVMR